jgi:hypothetical protein
VKVRTPSVPYAPPAPRASFGSKQALLSMDDEAPQPWGRSRNASRDAGPPGVIPTAGATPFGPIAPSLVQPGPFVQGSKQGTGQGSLGVATLAPPPPKEAPRFPATRVMYSSKG